jgi:hypothetical protein
VKDFVGWVYADPQPPPDAKQRRRRGRCSLHNTVNCSIADLELTVEREGEQARGFSLAGGAAYELGMRETDHGIPIQPYPDGELAGSGRRG